MPALPYVNNQNITGARCSLVLNGQVVALARSVSWSYAIEYQENRTLNNLRVESHAPTSYRCTISFSMFRVPKQTLATLGFFPQTGATPSAQIANVLSIAPLTAVIVDNVTGTAIATFTGVKIAGGSFTLDAGGNVLATEVDAVCVAMFDESEIAPAA